MRPSGFYSHYLRETSCWKATRKTSTFTLKSWPQVTWSAGPQGYGMAGSWVDKETEVTQLQPALRVWPSKPNFALQARLPVMKINEMTVVKGLEVVKTKQPATHTPETISSLFRMGLEYICQQQLWQSMAFRLCAHLCCIPSAIDNLNTGTQTRSKVMTWCLLTNLLTNGPAMDPAGFIFWWTSRNAFMKRVYRGSNSLCKVVTRSITSGQQTDFIWLSQGLYMDLLAFFFFLNREISH